MERIVYFSVSRSVAERSTLLPVRYRTKDGRFILSDKDLQRVRLLPGEFTSGLDVIMLPSKDEADRLIAEGGFLLGDDETIYGFGEAPKKEEQETDVTEKPVSESAVEDVAETEEQPDEEPVEETAEQSEEDEDETAASDEDENKEEEKEEEE